MDCPSCGRSNRPGARFCGGCGSSLAPRCPACGSESAPEARFCDACGTPLAAGRAEKAIARKVVTVVFADLIGSVSLHERLDAESARRVMDRYHRAMTAAVEVHGGRVVQLLGDGVLAAFGVPRVAEDDAMRAVRAAVGMQRAFRELVREQGPPMAGVGLRVAVNTGEVVVSDDETAVIGDPTNVAARLQQEARDGDVIVGEDTQRLVADLVTLAPLGRFALRGRSESVAAWRVVSLERPASARATAFVGRDEELRRLFAVYDAAVGRPGASDGPEAPGARLAVLLGSPGLGKSRLLAELGRRVGERATVLSGRCDAAGGVTFAPIAEALRGFLRIEEAGDDVLRAAIDAVVPGDEAERARIAAGIGALFSGAPSSPEETFFAVRRLLAALASVRPVVLVIDDLHWAEPLLLDLVEHLVQWSAGVPLMLLVAARPELRDARSSLATPGPLVADVVTLGGLEAGASMRLAASVVGAHELPAALVGRVLATSEGNPLFLGELVRMLVQDGTLRREGDRWVTTVEVSKLDMPPTIQVLLAARIERLRPEERSVLERAAVIGRQFSRSAVAHLLAAGAAELDARLEALRRSELVEPDSGWFLGEPALRFHHMLIRDAAYRRVLKETRAELHERFADWVAGRSGDALEHDETIGFHLAHAHQNRLELGPLDAHGKSLGERAARHLGAAGRRALARDDLALAASLLGRAIERLERDHPARADLALDWCEALLAAGEVGAAAGAIAELGRLAAGSERLRAWHACFAGQLAALTDPQSLRTTVGEVSRAAAVLAAAGDAAGEAKAHSVHAGALARLGEIGACETALDQALAAARRARDRRRSNAVLAGAPVAALWGPSPVTRASGRCLDVVRVLRITHGAPAVEAVALRCQAVLETLRGRGEAARRMIESSRRMVEELGIAQQLLEADVFAGLIDLLEGDAEAAEMSLRRAYEGLRERGLRIDAARAAALLGRALLAQGRAAEAESLSHESEVLGGDDLKAAIAWRGVRAQAQAEHGETAQAVELARAAVAIASATDALLDHADARLALATALRAAGRGPEADAEEARAIELWEAKGATLLTGRVRRADAAALAPPYPAPLAGDPARAARPRVRPNAATENEARVAASVAARDLDAFAALFAGDAVEVHHQAGVVLDAGEARRLYERMFAAEIEGLRVATEPLATLGERLALVRSHISLASGRAGEAVSVGATDMSSIALVEVGADGLRTRTEFFATDQLAAAIARIYERLAELEPEGPAREAAARRARVVAAIFVLAPLEPIEEHFAPAVELADHRVLGFGTVHGIEALRRSFPTLRGLADDVAVRVDDVLALDRDAFLLRSTTTGTEREGGGRFERPMLQLRCFGADGRMTRSEWFEPDRDAAALARFDELTRTEAPAVRRVRPNAATENMERLDAAMAARDVAAVEAVFAVEVEVIHHPLRAEFGRDGAIESLRTGLEDRALVFRHEPLATLGDALALSRLRVATNRIAIDDIDAGPVDFDHLVLVEVNGKGQRVRSEFFAPTELAAAITRLYERHAALVPDGPERERAAATARALDLGSMQPESVARRVAPEVELVDHRTAGLPPTRGAEALARVLAVAFEIADDAVDRLDDILAAEPHALLTRWTTAGRAREGGGAFEWAFLLLGLFGADGRTVRIEVFDGDRDEEAIARFEELAGGVPPPPSPNAAMRSEQATVEAWRARDWGAVEATYAPGFRSIDRRSLMRVETDREGMLTWLRPLFEMGVSRESTLLATRGDRLAIYRIRLSGSDGLSGPSEVELLQVIEVDQESGRRVAAVAFDAGDFDAAYAELDARYAAGEGAAFPRTADAMRAFAAALAHRDWEALAGCCAPDLVVDDHRRLGWEPLRGPAAYVAALRALVELAPDTQMRLDHVEMAERGFLVRTVWVGTRDGGAFEEPSWMVGAIDPAGRMRHLEQYDADRLDAARARFAELARSDPHGFGTNTAVAAHDRVIAAFAARDWEAMRACFAPGARIEDRRALLRTPPIDADTAVDAMRRGVEVASDLRTERRTFGVFGDCVSLERQTWRGGQGAAVFETEALTLVESDAAGRIAAIVTFGPADTLAAESEANDRWMAASRSPQAEPALAGLAELRAGREVRAPDPLRIPPNAAWRIWERIGAIVAARDWAALRSLAAADFEFDDRRRRALLRGEVELYIRNLAFVRSWPGRRVAPELVATAGERLALDRVAFVGDPDGGAFEGEFLRLTELDAEGRLRAVLHFDADDVAAAREELRARHARIEAPRADPLRIPPNAATRGVDRWLAAAGARDEAAMTALFSAAFRFDDRRPLVADSGDLEKMRASMRLALASGTRVSAETLATAGDQLALHRILFSSSDEEAPAEIEILQLVEVDAEGRIAATISFDPGDRRGAAVEMTERWARGESFFSASTLAALRALVEGDLEALRAALPQEFRFLDCRRTGLGALDRDAYVESLEALFEQSRDAMMEGLYTLATSACGSLSVARAFGTLAGGGTFESVYVRILHFRDEKLVGVELYELDDLERARARFDELRAGAEDVPR